MLLFASLSYAASTEFQLRNGDLLFQDLNCGEFCDSVDSVTYGYDNSYISHVAMVVNGDESNVLLVEAVSNGVTIVKLHDFLARTEDAEHHSRTMVGRINSLQYQNLIPEAINYSKNQIGKPYNNSFINANESAFYCSELIVSAFYHANHNQNVFHYNHMNFTNGISESITLLWQKYYANLHMSAPQGMIGTNPGMMSRESFITIVHYYGDLRRHDVASNNLLSAKEN